MASWNPNPCPMCKAELSTLSTEEVEPFEFSKYLVTLPDRTEISFEEATTQYFEENFPNYETDSFRVPAAFSYDQDESLDFVTNDEVTEVAPQKTKEKQQRGKGKAKRWKGPRTPLKILEDRRQKEAVDKIASAFYSHGKEILGPMILLSEFKFTNFAKNSKMPRNLKKTSLTFHGDHDVVIISRRKGIVFIQVKSIDNVASRTCWQQLKCAFEQLNKDELAMKSMNADLSFMKSLPMKGFIGVPNLTNEQLSDVNICSFHREITLTANKLEKEGINEFVFKCFSPNVESDHVLDINEYKHLASRYVGLASIVKMRSVSDAINSVGGRVSRMILNPDQVNCLQSCARRNIIMGDYGTGKSLLLVKKAEEVAKTEENVFVISFSSVFDSNVRVTTGDFDNLVSHLKRMDTSTNTRPAKNKVTIHSFVEHLKYIGKCKSLNYPAEKLKKEFSLTPNIICDVIEEGVKKHGRVHYFLDEVPLGGLCGRGWERFKTLGLCKDFFIWISVSQTSVPYLREGDYSVFDTSVDLEGCANYHKTYLTRCMRTTKNIFQLIQGLREFKNDSLRDVVGHGNMLHGPKPWWFEMNPCLCDNVETPFDCQCVKSRVSVTLTQIFEKLNRICKSDVIILVRDTSPEMVNFLLSVVEDACKASSISYIIRASGVERKRSWMEGSKTPVKVGRVWSFKGSESKVVIFVDPIAGPIAWKVEPPHLQVVPDICVAASRSLVHFIMVTWPQEERREFELNLSTSYLSLADDPDKGFEIFSPYLRFLASELKHEHPNHFWKGTFMGYLVEKDLVEKKVLERANKNEQDNGQPINKLQQHYVCREERTHWLGMNQFFFYFYLFFLFFIFYLPRFKNK